MPWPPPDPPPLILLASCIPCSKLRIRVKRPFITLSSTFSSKVFNFLEISKGSSGLPCLPLIPSFPSLPSTPDLPCLPSLPFSPVSPLTKSPLLHLSALSFFRVFVTVTKDELFAVPLLSSFFPILP